MWGSQRQAVTNVNPRNDNILVRFWWHEHWNSTLTESLWVRRYIILLVDLCCLHCLSVQIRAGRQKKAHLELSIGIWAQRRVSCIAGSLNAIWLAVDLKRLRNDYAVSIYRIWRWGKTKKYNSTLIIRSDKRAWADLHEEQIWVKNTRSGGSHCELTHWFVNCHLRFVILGDFGLVCNQWGREELELSTTKHWVRYFASTKVLELTFTSQFWKLLLLWPSTIYILTQHWSI